ncbi:hypothetical protein [Bifidobacterium vansinderenii]|uniref:Uncharacterized protein n=1 Tax=Bifidobacterium vansinderenii TaxID=1984871 RepID=A0A229VXS7_9BIFI|nr:hypothetical protein [Bifidobacterium vansinderenii]OXN00431.1 hypothetical protein Tam10B_1301 [Bifidobacterium vansinderenii]
MVGEITTSRDANRVAWDKPGDWMPFSTAMPDTELHRLSVATGRLTDQVDELCAYCESHGEPLTRDAAESAIAAALRAEPSSVEELAGSATGLKGPAALLIQALTRTSRNGAVTDEPASSDDGSVLMWGIAELASAQNRTMPAQENHIQNGLDANAKRDLIESYLHSIITSLRIKFDTDERLAALDDEPDDDGFDPFAELNG